MQVTTRTTLRMGRPGAYESVLPGETIELPAPEAQSLIVRGLVIAHRDNTAQPNDLIDAILDAIDDLKPDAFGKDGKPNVKAIEGIIGQSLTAAERDRAWATYRSLVDDEP